MSENRASMHSGKGYATHNDLTGELGEHVDREMSKLNLYYTYDETGRGKRIIPTPKENFYTHEINYYKKAFGDALYEQNERHRASRHYDRVKTIEDVYRSSKTECEEQIYQYGNIDTPVDELPTQAELANMMKEQIEWEKSQLGDNYQPLDFSVHMGEVTPHVHKRSVYQYRDAEGNLRVGQEKALEQAGIPLPNPDMDMKKATKGQKRFNNRKITWDNMRREHWYDTLEKYGFEVEREPLPPRKSKNIKQYKEQATRQTEEALQRASILESGLDARETALEAREDVLEQREANIALERQSLDMGLKRLKSDVESVEADKSTLEAEKRKFEAYRASQIQSISEQSAALRQREAAETAREAHNQEVYDKVKAYHEKAVKVYKGTPRAKVAQETLSEVEKAQMTYDRMQDIDKHIDGSNLSL